MTVRKQEGKVRRPWVTPEAREVSCGLEVTAYAGGLPIPARRR